MGVVVMQRRPFLLAIAAWIVLAVVSLIVLLVLYQASGPKAVDDASGFLALGVVLVAGAAWKASSTSRAVVNGIVGGIAGLVGVYLAGVGLAFATGDATAAEGESAFSMLIEGPFWLALFSPIAAGLGIVGATVRFSAAGALRRLRRTKGA
jgi:hypothetical protein